MARVDTVRFAIQHYKEDTRYFKNDFIAQLPGLLITQYPVNGSEFIHDKTALRFDFLDDWYNIIAFLDESNNATGHYRISMQSPLSIEDGLWQGDDLLLGIEITGNWKYAITGEENFHMAIDDGWIMLQTAAQVQDSLRCFCSMLNDGCLPQEVMDAVGV